MLHGLLFSTKGASWRGCQPQFTVHMTVQSVMTGGLVVTSPASRAEDPEFESRLRRDFFWGGVIPVTEKLALQWLPCQAPGVIVSVLGLCVSIL